MLNQKRLTQKYRELANMLAIVKINWDTLEVLEIEKEKNKFSLQKNLLVRESLEI